MSLHRNSTAIAVNKMPCSAPMIINKGIGLALTNGAKGWPRALGASKIHLMLRDDNAAALGFYAALGYDVQKVVTIGKKA
jgi:hypothetical protein